jgi:uncharacterized protein (DUF305 family)
MIKIASTLLIAFFAVFNSCERPPVQKDLPDHKSMDHSRMDHGEMVSSPGAAAAPYELQFIDTMIAHHQGAVDMAQLVPTRAQHDELNNLARSIVADQQREIAEMKDLRARWFGEKPPAINMDLPGMREGMRGMDLAKLDSLKENAFDLEFIHQMIPHHEGAIVMANDALSKDTNAELKKLAEDIVQAQGSEINRMHLWEKEWHK